MFIGFYDYTVVLTYMSLLSSIVGMTEALDGRFGNAIACLVVSGICDMLDGKVARTKKDRTEDQKNFGIQIDSLCDLFCFGAFPAFLTYALGVRGIVGTISMCVYVLAAVIRLGYFNVKEMRRQQETEERRKSYEGLPVTSISIIFPLIYLLRPYCGHTAYLRILIAVMFIVAFLFVSKIRVLKPGNKLMAFFMVLFMVKFLISFLVFCLISCFLQVQCIQFRLKEKPKKDKVLVKSKFFLPLVFFPLYQKKVLDGKEKTA